MIPEFSDDDRCIAWPFWVLQLTPKASAADIEKAARDISAKLKFGMEEAKVFVSPLGTHPRDEFIVREAKSLLQDPAGRLLCEFWYVDPKMFSEISDDSKQETVSDWYAHLKIN